MLLGRYPEGFAELMPVQDGDLATIHQPLDFYGFNYYNPMSIAAAAEGAEIPFEQHELDAGYPTTDFGWPVVPDGLREVIGQLRERYPDIPPLYVTENGCSYGDGSRRSTASSTTSRGSTTSTATCAPWPTRSPTAPTCAATTAGR